MLSLDDLNFIASLDKKNLAKLMVETSSQGINILEEVKSHLSFPKNWLNSKNQPNFNKIVAIGMGGSGIVGDLVKMLINPPLPFLVIKDDKIEPFLDKNSLSIIISFSGQTKETLSCFRQALAKKSKIFVISSNGELLKLAKSKKIPFFQINHPGPPRVALIAQLIPLLILFENLHLAHFKGLSSSLKKAEKRSHSFSLNTPSKKNKAKHLASNLFNHLPIIISSVEEKAIAQRWANQFQENSKNFAFTGQWPEIFHNLVEARLPKFTKEKLFFLILTSTKEENIEKLTFSLKQKQISYTTIIGQGENYLEKIWYLINLGDWTSYYLAILNNVDPRPTDQITLLKNKKICGKS